MKKSLYGIIFFMLTMIMVFAGAFSASAYSTEICTGESVDVASFAQLKEALENFQHGGNVVLKSNISFADDNNDCSIKLTGNGAVSVDMNGFNITVNSKATKYLFEITGQSRVYFVNSSEDRTTTGTSKRSVVYFNTTQPGSAIVRLDHIYAEFSNVNADFTMGYFSGYDATTDGSDSSIISVNKASEVNIYSGSLQNKMKTGNGITIASNDSNKQKLYFRVGGSAAIDVYKHCVSFDPAYVKYIKFGTVRFRSINPDSDAYARINVPSGCSMTVRDLWSTSEAGSTAYVYNGGILPIVQTKKVTSLDKKDVTADKTCETLSNADYYMVLNCSAGHIRLCGTCFMAYKGIESHTMSTQSGSVATCVSEGRTSGQICKNCSYSTSKTIPKTGHNMTYVKGNEVSCGVNGVREHYYCSYCRTYYSDAEGTKVIDKNDINIENNHVITHLAAKPATCTTTGLTAGIKCETCGVMKQPQEIIPAKGHTEVKIVEPYEATCSREGRTSGKKCSVCSLVIEESVVIPQKAHTTKVVEGYPASCKTSGLTYGEVCVVCGYVIKAQETIPPKGHIEKVYEGVKATCQSDGLTDGLVCEVCGLVTKEREKIAKGPHVPEIIKGKSATCSEDGLTDGSICKECGITLEKQEVIPANGEHKETLVKGTPATCQSEGLTEGIKCSICNKMLTEQKVIAKLPHTEKVIKGKAATCSEEGLSDGIECAVCRKVIEKQTVIPKTAHTEKVVKGTAATCEKEGKTDGVNCSVCGEVITAQKVIAKLPHTEKVVEGKDATCQKEGLSDGIICSVCGETVKKQTEIPKKDHVVSASVLRADSEKDGEITESCAVCKDELSRKTISRIDTVTLSTTKYTYNGSAKKPSVTVKTAKGEALEKNVDYKVSYDKGRKEIGTYNVKVTFIGKYSGEKTLSFTVNPSKTEKITVSQTTTSIKLSWQKVEGATGYRVYLYNEKTKKYKALGTTSKMSCTINKLATGTEYKFAVKAYTKTEKGTLWSKTYTEILTATRPAVPVVTAKADTGKVSLSWKEVSGVTGYVVYMSESKDGTYKKLGATTKLSCTVKNLQKGKTYYFKVKAYTRVDGKNVYSEATKVIKVKIK